MRGLTNQKLMDLGSKLEFCQGLPELFQNLSAIPKESKFIHHDFKIEHYIISTGLSPMIKGSAIYPYVEDVFACEFISSPLPLILEAKLSFPYPLIWKLLKSA